MTVTPTACHRPLDLSRKSSTLRDQAGCVACPYERAVRAGQRSGRRLKLDELFDAAHWWSKDDDASNWIFTMTLDEIRIAAHLLCIGVRRASGRMGISVDRSGSPPRDWKPP
ncbi:MAG: hypothetical protein R3C02_18855 [Planctomycetaceae bacterium]